MRFNNKELATIAQEPPDKFDREGVLYIKEKNDGLFKKGEVYVERFCRLRGNLLFYFKANNVKSEPVGVLVLERCTVELDLKEELPFSFQLVYEKDDRIQYLAAKSESERDSWIESLHIASYECMKMQLESLREQIRHKTGRDPIENPEPSVLVDVGTESDEPVLEICIMCDNLPTAVNGRLPNPYITVFAITPPQQRWSKIAQTEVVESDCNPCFLKTVSFYSCNAALLTTRIKLVIHDVKERLSGTMTQIGNVVFTLQDVVNAPDNKLRQKICCPDVRDAGSVTVMSWQNDEADRTSKLTIVEENEQEGEEEDALGPLNIGPPKRPPRKGSRTKCRDMLNPLYDNIYTKTFRFPTTSNAELKVHEYMGESKMTFHLPQMLLKIWVEEVKNRIDLLQGLGELTPTWNNLRQEVLDYQMSTVSTYSQCCKHLADYKDITFKPSSKKACKELEFVPVNLHLQRMWVTSDARKSGPTGCYDIITVGCFTAYPHKYKQGGLHRLLKQQTTTSRDKQKLRTINKLLTNTSPLRSAVQYHSESVNRAAMQGNGKELETAVQTLSVKIRELIEALENDIVEDGIQAYIDSKPEPKIQINQTRNSCKSVAYDSRDSTLSYNSDYGRESLSSVDDGPGSPIIASPLPSVSEPEEEEKQWKWNGHEMVKSPTIEPWDVTRQNTEAVLVTVISKSDHLVHSMTDETGNWLGEISPLIIKLKSCVEVMCQRAMNGLTFAMLQEQSKDIPLMHTIRYRRDVVFSQSFTAAVTGFMTKLRSNITNETFLQQLYQIGVLMEFEGLLSCHGDEMGMLEDFMIGVDDLRNVCFRIEESIKSDEILPTLEGNRTGYIVRVPCPDSMFHLLPLEIQRGHLIRPVTVMFNVGINEQATLAEKFGDTSLQEAINMEGLKTLNSYYEKYVELYGNPDSGAGSLEDMMRTLSLNVHARKNKNVEILQLAGEVCRKMNGVRFTSCKSAKDRTAMSVTLEQVQILQREHDLASHVFSHALQCTRSEGVRRHNTFKNTGTLKYAFNSIQLVAFPKLYRPPTGTFGNVES